jgi:hypothetical protein
MNLYQCKINNGKYTQYLRLQAENDKEAFNIGNVWCRNYNKEWYIGQVENKGKLKNYCILPPMLECNPSLFMS